MRVGGNDKAADHAEYIFPLYYSTDTARPGPDSPPIRARASTTAADIAVTSDGSRRAYGIPRAKRPCPHRRLGRDLDSEHRRHRASAYAPTADPVNPNVFYAFDNGVLKSTDKGVSFAKVDSRNFSSTADLQ